jgi:hypothetical protein
MREKTFIPVSLSSFDPPALIAANGVQAQLISSETIH